MRTTPKAALEILHSLAPLDLWIKRKPQQPISGYRITECGREYWYTAFRCRSHKKQNKRYARGGQIGFQRKYTVHTHYPRQRGVDRRRDGLPAGLDGVLQGEIKIIRGARLGSWSICSKREQQHVEASISVLIAKLLSRRSDPLK